MSVFMWKKLKISKFLKKNNILIVLFNFIEKNSELLFECVHLTNVICVFYFSVFHEYFSRLSCAAVATLKSS